MGLNTPVEIADQVSRKRAGMVAFAAIAFVLVQVAARPYFVGGGDVASHVQFNYWAVNAAVLLLCLATGGGLLQSRQLRSLVNDEVARSNYKTAVVTGYWVAMTAAVGLYLWAGFRRVTAREAIYVIVTPSIAVALLVFALLEFRAHRDASVE
jgi:hypothetical protein